MSVHPQRLRRINSFLQLAEEEESAAQRLLPGFPRQAAFFLQQAVEKLLRAVIEAEDGKAGISHNIRELARLLPEKNPLLSRFLEHEGISSAATRYRYPLGGGGIADPDPIEDLIAELASIAKLRSAVTEYLKLKGFLPKA